jgi:hypothetical protein
MYSAFIHWSTLHEGKKRSFICSERLNCIMLQFLHLVSVNFQKTHFLHFPNLNVKVHVRLQFSLKFFKGRR